MGEGTSCDNGGTNSKDTNEGHDHNNITTTIDDDDDDDDEGEGEEKINRGIPGANLPAKSVSAAVALDSVIQQLQSSFGADVEGTTDTGGRSASGSVCTDYFDTLARVFRDVLNKEDQSYMKNFYVIIPALTLSFIDHIRNAKFKMNKVRRPGVTAFFTDDGFTLGTAFMLAVLKQRTNFLSLHWFDSCSRRLAAVEALVRKEGQTRDSAIRGKRRGKAREAPAARHQDSIAEEETSLEAGGRLEEELRHVSDDELRLRMQRLKDRRRELELVQFSLSGAAAFFHD